MFFAHAHGHVSVNSSDADTATLQGMRLSLYDDMMSSDPTQCGSAERPMNVNYELVCIDDPDDDTVLIPSVVGNATHCQYNITVMSRWSCAKVVGADSKDDLIEDLSAGSMLLIIVGVVCLVYVVVGCGYNGVVRGKVGFEAMPNQRMWRQLARYTYYGCKTARDTCCFCGASPTKYQEL